MRAGGGTSGPLAITSREERGGEAKRYGTGSAAVPAGSQRRVFIQMSRPFALRDAGKLPRSRNRHAGREGKENLQFQPRLAVRRGNVAQPCADLLATQRRRIPAWDPLPAAAALGPGMVAREGRG